MLKYHSATITSARSTIASPSVPVLSSDPFTTIPTDSFFITSLIKCTTNAAIPLPYSQRRLQDFTASGTKVSLKVGVVKKLGVVMTTPT